MANQAIALQARAPRGNILSPAIQQGAQMVNMMRQQETADRQAAATNQQLEIARAKEAREIPLANAQLSKAEAEALAARLQNGITFFTITNKGMEAAANADAARAFGEQLKTAFPEPFFTGLVDQTLATLPDDPALFGSWRDGIRRNSLTNAQKLSRDLIERTTGAEKRTFSRPTYGGGADDEVTEIPELRVNMPEEVTYVRDGQGRIIPMPKTLPGTGGFGGETNAPVVRPNIRLGQPMADTARPPPVGRRSSAASGRPRAANSGKAKAPLTIVSMEVIAP
jgi:hypothetical protein